MGLDLLKQKLQLDDYPETSLNTTGTVGGHKKPASSVKTGVDQQNCHEDTTEVVDIQVAAGVMNSTVLLEDTRSVGAVSRGSFWG